MLWSPASIGILRVAADSDIGVVSSSTPLRYEAVISSGFTASGSSKERSKLP